MFQKVSLEVKQCQIYTAMISCPLGLLSYCIDPIIKKHGKNIAPGLSIVMKHYEKVVRDNTSVHACKEKLTMGSQQGQWTSRQEDSSRTRPADSE